MLWDYGEVLFIDRNGLLQPPIKEFDGTGKNTSNSSRDVTSMMPYNKSVHLLVQIASVAMV